MLAYRNIKRNTGSHTAGVDGKDIRYLENLGSDEFCALIKRKFQWYRPHPVKRVEIPKGNGKMRPLGIPTIIDRVVQQCILEEHSWNVEENTVKPRFQTRHEPECKDASLINTTDLEQWFGGQDGMSTILNSLQMFEQN